MSDALLWSLVLNRGDVLGFGCMVLGGDVDTAVCYPVRIAGLLMLNVLFDDGGGGFLSGS